MVHLVRRNVTYKLPFGLLIRRPRLRRKGDPLHVPGSTPNCAAILRTTGLPGIARAFLLRSSSSGAIRGRLSLAPGLRRCVVLL
jgi:hypothetical protein